MLPKVIACLPPLILPALKFWFLQSVKEIDFLNHNEKSQWNSIWINKCRITFPIYFDHSGWYHWEYHVSSNLHTDIILIYLISDIYTHFLAWSIKSVICIWTCHLAVQPASMVKHDPVIWLAASEQINSTNFATCKKLIHFIINNSYSRLISCDC